MLEVEHLCFSYGKREVLRGVDLRAEPGELVFVLGANGAGKTTLFRCILGLLPGYQGCVRVDGCDVSSLAPRALAKKIAYIPQTSHMIFPYTALELVLMGTNHRLGLFSAPGRRERAIAMEALEELGIADYAHRSFAELSGGEQQLVLAARALAQQARLLLMDEPTSALDFGNQVRVLERVSALTLRGYTVLLSCHNPQHAMLYAQRVVALHDGLVAADGPPDQALAARLCEKGITNVSVYDVSNTHVSYLISEAFKYSHIVLASVTYNLGIYPVMKSFLEDMKALNLQNRTFALIENGSWACKSGDLMQAFIDEELKNMTVLNERLSLASSLQADKAAELDQLADALVESLQEDLEN